MLKNINMSYNNCQFTWLKQKETLVSLAESLLKDSAFYDCQLCAEGHHFNVHRVILSCNSPIFSNILQEHNSDLPVITLEGISSVELGALVEFMYTGVTRISPNYLKNFFQIANSLQLAGLNHYDNSQIDKIINESDAQVTHSEFHENYEAFSQKILKYLDQSEENDESEEKDMTILNANGESIFFNEATEPVDIVSDNSVIYKEYGDFVKGENDDGVESLESQLVENEDCSQNSDAVDSHEGDKSTAKAPLMFNRFHNILIKNEEKVFNNNVATVYSYTNFDDLEVKNESEFLELQKEIKVTNEDENLVFVKLDDDALDRLKESQSPKGKQILSKNDVRFYTKKCLRVINPVEKNFLIKRPKIQSLVGKETKTSGDDKKIYICLKCGNKYSHRRTLLHHIHWICEQPATYSCSLCPYRGKRKFQLKSHMKHAHLLKMS